MQVTNGQNGTPGTVVTDAGANSDTVSTHRCVIADVIARISDKWSIYAIMRLGHYEKMRFGELQKSIGGISQRMLTVTLRSLEQDGLVTRTVFPEIPPRVEYRLTPTGLSLRAQLISLSEWAEEDMNHIFDSRSNYRTPK